MKIEHEKKNERRFGSLARGEVFEYKGDYYMTIEPVDTNYNDHYNVYDTTYNAVNLYTAQLEWFSLDCLVELFPNAALKI
jgi:hypothetical protein